MKKRITSCLLVLCMVLAMLPTAAFAAGDHWAASAVDTLNKMYNIQSLFEANDKDLSFKDAKSTLDAAGWHSDAFDEAYAAKDSENNPVSRGLACTVLAEIFNLPIGNESAIEYLSRKNIINGYANGDLGENDPVSMAQFAVVTYRILNSIGGGASSTTGLIPGTVEYNSWMFLTNRGVVEKDGHEGNIDETTWNEWVGKLDPEKTVFKENTPPLPGEESETVTKLQAAVDLVKAYVNAGGNDGKMQVFSDVAPGDWYYDGVMYLFDHGIVMGYGSERIGQFGPNDELTNGQLASLLCRASGINTDPGEVEDKWTASQKLAIKAANDEKWMTVAEDSYNTVATREIAIAAVIKWLNSENDGVNVDKDTVNTDILERFNDGNTISTDNAPYVAYAVSIGILNGNKDGDLTPNAGTTRAMFGVIMYRVLIGVDETKMKDYEDNVEYAKGGTTVQTFALRAATTNTLTLREDWRLTSELDLNTNEPLIIDGNGHYIYEMGGEAGGKLTNSGTGVVTFQNTALYPAPDDADAADITPDGIWDAGESEELMRLRQPHIITVEDCTNGTVTAGAATASKGGTVTLTVAPEQGYELDTLTVTATEGSGGAVSVSNNSFTMPASDVTVSATFKQAGTVTPTTYTVTVQNDGNGTASASPASAAQGTEITLTATANSGYHFKEWQVVSGTVTISGSSFTMPAENVTVKAIFEKDSGGGSSGGGSSSSGSNSGTTTETTKHPDGSITTTVTDTTTGIVTETTKTPDGSTLVVETRKDGTVTTTDTAANGVKVKTVDHPGEDVTASVTIPGSVEEAVVTIPADVDYGMVAVDAKTGKVFKLSIPTEDGMTVKLDASAELILVDDAKDFADTNNHWAEDAIDFVTARGLYNGTSATTFAPDGSMTRAMLAKVLHNLESNPDFTAQKLFTDLPNGHWAEDAIYWAAEKGIVGGYTNGAFGVDDAITREQLAVMLWRYAGCPESTHDLSRFEDIGNISSYALEALAWANEHGIVNGIGNNLISPQGQATRAQVATMLMRMVQATLK